MSDTLSSVKQACIEAVDAVREVSAKMPGSKTTQVLVVGLTVGAISYLLLGRVLKREVRLPPGPFALPLLGNILLAMSKKEPLYTTLDRWAEPEEYGPVIMIYFGPLKCVTLNRLDVVKEALVDKGADFAGRPMLYSLSLISEDYKDIIFASDSAGWKLQRKIASRALRHFMRGELLEKVVHRDITMVMDKMAEEKEPFVINYYMNFLMFHVTDTICFGKFKEFDDPVVKDLAQMFQVVGEEIGNGFLEDVLPPLRYFPTKKFRWFMGCMKKFRDRMHEEVDEHRKTFSENNIRDMMDTILLAQKEIEAEETPEVMAMFTDTHVSQTIGNIFGGSIDTSRLTLDWCMLYMAGHPEVQTKVQAEIDAVTGSRMPGLADHSNLVYTEATLHEIMRLGTVVPMSLPHQTLCDTTVAGYDIPKGTMILINLWALLHDKENWDNPHEFNPNRFIDVNGKLKLKMEGWLPFSMGRRACLAEFVAKPELLLIFACLMKQFKISLPPGAVFDPTPQTGSLLNHLPKPYKVVISRR